MTIHSLITDGYSASTTLLITEGYASSVSPSTTTSMLAKAILNMENKQPTRSFFVTGFMEPGFATYSVLNENIDRLES